MKPQEQYRDPGAGSVERFQREQNSLDDQIMAEERRERLLDYEPMDTVATPLTRIVDNPEPKT